MFTPGSGIQTKIIPTTTVLLSVSVLLIPGPPGNVQGPLAQGFQDSPEITKKFWKFTSSRWLLTS